MKLILAALASIALIQADGCPTTPKPAIQVAQPVKYQRFLPVTSPLPGAGAPWAGFFALDTQTGQLCLTTGVHIPAGYTEPTCDEIVRGESAVSAVNSNGSKPKTASEYLESIGAQPK